MSFGLSDVHLSFGEGVGDDLDRGSAQRDFTPAAAVRLRRDTGRGGETE
jgi:hypothetical protein